VSKCWFYIHESLSSFLCNSYRHKLSCREWVNVAPLWRTIESIIFFHFTLTPTCSRQAQRIARRKTRLCQFKASNKRTKETFFIIFQATSLHFPIFLFCTRRLSPQTVICHDLSQIIVTCVFPIRLKAFLYCVIGTTRSQCINHFLPCAALPKRIFLFVSIALPLWLFVYFFTLERTLPYTARYCPLLLGLLHFSI
jgi:hypothetical protein